MLDKLSSLIPDKFLDPMFIWLKGALIWLVGDLNYQLGYLLIVIMVDMLFATWAAKKHNEFEWSILLTKLRGKLTVYALWIIAFHAVDKMLNLPNSGRWMVTVALLGAEILSSAKNTAKLGYTHIADALENIYKSLTTNITKAQGGSTKNVKSTKTNRKKES